MRLSEEFFKGDNRGIFRDPNLPHTHTNFKAGGGNNAVGGDGKMRKLCRKLRGKCGNNAEIMRSFHKAKIDQKAKISPRRRKKSKKYSPPLFDKKTKISLALNLEL